MLICDKFPTDFDLIFVDLVKFGRGVVEFFSSKTLDEVELCRRTRGVEQAEMLELIWLKG